MQTGGHPAVYGEWLHAPSKPTVLLYGHSDTQPADATELWTNPPFEPTIVGDRVYARGAVQNPAYALAHVLSSMRSPDGKIAIEGFFDCVVPLTGDDRASIAAVPFDDYEYKRQLGVDELFGEPGYTTLERAWARPTLGTCGGFQGEASKTVLPAKAGAKITCRLHQNQEPEEIMSLIAVRRQPLHRLQKLMMTESNSMLGCSPRDIATYGARITPIRLKNNECKAAKADELGAMVERPTP